MPVDTTIDPKGNVAFIERPGSAPLAVVLDANGKAPHESLQPSVGAPLYLSHFVTCPAAGLHRRSK